MRFTISALAIAAATFAATLAFAPAIASVAEHFAFQQSGIVHVSSPAKEDNRCPPVAKILAALNSKECA